MKTMTLKQKIVPAAMSAVFTIAAFVFLGFFYTYHMHYQEQLQLFQFTTAYFSEVVSVPGGFADYLGRFITQFCYYARTGAFLIALLLLGVQLLTYACMLSGRHPLTSPSKHPSTSTSTSPFPFPGTNYALSFLPAACLFIFLLDENAMLGAVVAVALSLAGAWGVTLIKNPQIRIPVLLAGIPVMYMLCGPLAIIYVIVALKPEKWQAWIPAVVIAIACPIISQYIFAYPVERLIKGIHYHRYPLVMPLWIWISAACAILVSLCGRLPQLHPSNHPQSAPTTAPTNTPTKFLPISTYLSIIILGCIMTSIVSDPKKEELMKYDFMVQHRMWNRIMMTADKKSPDTPMSVSCLNIALAQTGRMNTNMFDYFQNGPDGLLPKFVRDCTSPVPTGEIYWHLGMVNTAQRFFFEAQEAIPDFQKSGRFYKKLAETNIVNRDYNVASKYLETLDNTLFYRKWSKNAERIIQDTTAIKDFPEYVRERALRFQHHDFLYSDKEMDSMLGLLTVENRDNTLAYEYLLAWTLLKKDLQRFLECYSLVNYIDAPKHYQEAVLLYWVNTHTDFNGLPLDIDRKNAARMEQFIKAYNAHADMSAMQKKFGDTYWFYYYYRNN